MKTLLLLMLLFMGLQSNGQNTQRINYRNIEFNLPPDCIGSENVEGYLIENKDADYYIIVRPASFASQDAIIQELNSNALGGESNAEFIRNSEITSITNNAFGAQYTLSSENQYYYMYIAGVMGANNRGAMLVGGKKSGTQSLVYELACKQLISKLTFKNIEARSGMLNQWEKNYANTSLTYMDSYYSSGYGDSYGAYRQKIVIQLSGQGLFTYSDNFEMGGGGDASAFIGKNGNAGEGNWYIKQNNNEVFLILEFYNGKLYEYRLETDAEGATYLNGKRYYCTTN
ncbi:hypothetical protein [Carboxylicivirga linearis]|uniref:Uncharacterized protein n=1 Tax=Carboxylicivirga linearis TaxID=1628157 RepID=A0ABS5JWJ9_9BACT|nr:hypothetical protein [Carboxylicivirga linearis]MBS2099285.1 hypothetical protein [Carboxylicivirga linearis]